MSVGYDLARRALLRGERVRVTRFTSEVMREREGLVAITEDLALFLDTSDIARGRAAEYRVEIREADALVKLGADEHRVVASQLDIEAFAAELAAGKAVFVDRLLSPLKPGAADETFIAGSLELRLAVNTRQARYLLRLGATRRG